MSFKTLLPLALTALLASPALAATVSVSTQGMLTSFGSNNGSFNAAPGNFYIGHHDSGGSFDARSYFIFSLPNVDVTTANLVLTLPFNSYLSPDPSETWTLFDVTPSNIPALQNQFGG